MTIEVIEGHLFIKNYTFLRYLFCSKSNLIKILNEC